MWKILALLIACIVVLSFADSTQTTEINIWNKVSSDELNPGEIVPLDMSRGYAFADHAYIYIIVKPVDGSDDMIIVFPNGGYWTSPEPDPFLQEMQKEFDSLESYLRNQKSEEIKKK